MQRPDNTRSMSSPSWKQKLLKTASPKIKHEVDFSPTTPPSVTFSGDFSPHSRQSSMSSLTKTPPSAGSKFSFPLLRRNFSFSSTSSTSLYLTSLDARESQCNPLFADFPITMGHSPPKVKPRGPKIKPYIFTQTQQPQRHRANSAQLKCFICDELLRTRLVYEVVIELKCGDLVHSECFMLLVGAEVKPSPTPSNSFFPICKGPQCTPQNETKRMVPVDNYLAQKLLSDVVLQQEDVRDSRILETTIGCHEVLAAKKLLLPQPQLHRFTTTSSRFSTFSSSTRSPSPNPSISTMNTVLVTVSTHKDIPLDSLKDAFIRYLLDNCKKMTLTTLLSLGPLRLVDRLYVKTKEDSFDMRNCYLFTNFLVVWSTNKDVEPIIFSLVKQHISIQAPKPNTIQINNPLCSPEMICLHSETSSIIDKWGLAISDPHFITFPSEIVTSTILMSEMVPTAEPVSSPASTINYARPFEASTDQLSRPDSVCSETSPESDSGSDIDSDDEQIDRIMRDTALQNSKIDNVINSCSDGWKKLHDYLDEEIQNSQ